MDGAATEPARERGREGVLPRRRRRRAQELPRREELQAPQALAGMSDGLLRRARNRDPRRARARPAGARCRGRSRRRRPRRGLRARSSTASMPADDHEPRGAGEAAGHAQVRAAGAAAGAPRERPVRRLLGAMPLGPRMPRVFASPGPIYEPEGEARDYWRAARALLRRGLSRAATWCTTASATT